MMLFIVAALALSFIVPLVVAWVALIGGPRQTVAS